MKATLYCDGGARGNPGPAGIGFVLAGEALETVQCGEYIGEATNNVAEYKALIAGLSRAARAAVTELSVFLDSELVVRQMQGKYRVKDAKLKLLFVEAQQLAGQFRPITFQHVRREKNAVADTLVNRAIDDHTKTRPG